MDKFDKFTKEAKQALVVAQEKAREAKLNYVGTEHVLIGILSQTNSLGASILLNFGVSLDNVYLVLKTVGRVGSNDQKNYSDGPGGLSGFAKKVIEDAVKCAHEFGHSFVGTEHLLFSLVSQENTAATVILENMKVDPRDIKDQIIEAFEKSKGMAANMAAGTAASGPNSNPASGTAADPKNMNPIEFFLSGLHGVLVGNMQKEPYKNTAKQQTNATKQQEAEKASKTPALDYFANDLVADVRKGKIDNIIGRSQEIQRVISILCRKTKNNPVLIGEPGVGKTAIAEGLAQAIASEQVPDSLLDKKILNLSMTSVVAGTKYRGEFEERFKQIIDEAASTSNVILFIDELHTVVGAGSAEGSLDAANILKPALSRSRVQVIGATTTAEYRKQIENDAALERRFQQVVVPEPSDEESIAILNGIRESFEDHHNLIIEDEAINAAVKMSKRYLNDRFLPDKAIDLIDEACSLKRTTKKGSNANKVSKLQKKLTKIIKEKEASVSRQDYEKAAELRNDELVVMKQISEAKNVKIPRSKRDKIVDDDIARVVSNMTGVPVTKLVESEITALNDLENNLKSYIVGQDEAIGAISKAIRRSRAGFADHDRPIGSFIFLGPTGVGKTELVKRLAQEVYNDKDALIKIDMSEFMERHNTSRLVGAAAGYVGYDDGGQLTEQVRRKPYSIILFDEIEKAHPDVFNLLLQILEDGHLTDSKGRTVDFKNTIIIMTSNIGAKRLTDTAGGIGFASDSTELKRREEDYDEVKDDILDELKKAFRPEFLNRIDKTIVFNALTHNDIESIVKLHVDFLDERIADKELSLNLHKEGLKTLCHLGFDPQYGARPVRRAIQEHVEDPLTGKFLDQEFKPGDIINITGDGEEKVILKKKLAKKAPKPTKAMKEGRKRVVKAKKELLENESVEK